MADKNVIIKQKLENEIVDFYPKTKSNIVVNESNITGSTVTDVFNNALPIKAGEHISITPDASGVKIDFTGSLAPNVTVEAGTYTPIKVDAKVQETTATYTVSHAITGPLAGYTSKNEITTIDAGESKTIKIPQIKVDQFGHVTEAADEDVKITIPSTANMVTGTGLTKDKIILGNADTNNSSKVKASDYGISNDSTNSTHKDKTIWTQQAVETLINNKITEGAQYLGIVNGWDYNTGSLTYKENESSPITYITPNSQGDWARAVKPFNIPYAVNGNSTGPNGPSELVHTGDIIIFHDTSAGNKYLWDVIHTEVDTDTWRPIQVGSTTLSDSSTTLIINGASGITTALSGGTLTLTGTTYSVSQNTNKNKFTFTSSSGASTEIEINNVANATEANHVKNSLIVKFDTGDVENTNLFTYNGSAEKTIRISPVAIGAAQDDHDHGQINNNGRMTSPGTDIQDGDRIVFTDNSDYNKIKRSSITFGANTDANKTKALTQAGTWATFLQANQNITINSGLKHKNNPSDSPVYIKGTASGTEPTLGKSGVGAGIYSTIEVNEQGIAIAGSQVIKYYASGTTNATIQGDTMLAAGGFAFVEIA